jgi:hypothetical protein
VVKNACEAGIWSGAANCSTTTQRNWTTGAMQQFMDFLKLPLAGNRNHEGANLLQQAHHGLYRTSSPFERNASLLFLDSGQVNAGFIHYRAHAFSVRCFQNVIDTTPLLGTVAYSTTETTNQEVTVTLTLNKMGTVLES